MDNEEVMIDPKLQAILDKVVELFYEFGIRNLNMDDISRKLKISKKTLYQYFKSKEDLIEKLFYYDDIKWCGKLAKYKFDEVNAIDILIQVSIMVADEMSRLNPQLKFELKKYYEPIFNQFLQKKHNHIFEQISKNIQRGINEGLYRADVNIELTAGLYMRNLVEMHEKDLSMVENITFDQVFETMFENHIRAISTARGIEYFEKRKSELPQINKNFNNQ
jgi:AcrR family transcriptional regulator